jgi:TetR/AcrR family transcriptional regulator, transcriptional repressor for nem operon
LIDGIVEGQRRWGCLITNTIVELAQREPAIKRKLDSHLARMERAFASAIDRARRAGEIPREPPLERAAFRVSVVEGMNVLAKMKPSREKLELNVSAALLSLRI